MYLIVINLFVFLVTVQTYVVHDRCITVEGGLGTCIPIQKCAPILLYNKEPEKSPADVKFLQQSWCGFGPKQSLKICCPKETKEWKFLVKLITSGEDLSKYYYSEVETTTTATEQPATEATETINLFDNNSNTIISPSDYNNTPLNLIEDNSNDHLIKFDDNSNDSFSPFDDNTSVTYDSYIDILSIFGKNTNTIISPIDDNNNSNIKPIDDNNNSNIKPTNDNNNSNIKPTDDNNTTRIFSPLQCPPTVEPPKFDSRCCGIDVSSPFKIKGGDDISIDKHPWVAILLYENERIGCGGTLISSRYVLTAAHCIETKLGPVVKVRLADYDLATFPTDLVESGTGDFEQIDAMEFNAERQIVHPQYNFEDSSHDIGLIKLSDNAPFTDFIRPVCLPTYDATKTLQNGTLFTIAGWGYDRAGSEINQIKQELQLPYADKEECQASYVEDITENQFCAGGDSGKDACDGDSGNNLVYEDIKEGVTMAVGVGSFGPLICGLKDTPSVFVNVYRYLEWIYSETV